MYPQVWTQVYAKLRCRYCGEEIKIGGYHSLDWESCEAVEACEVYKLILSQL